MRLKHVKGAREKVDNSKYVILDSRYKGKYNNLFNNDNNIHVEIGMGKGNFIVNMALNNPDINFIGIEKYDSVLVRALEKQEQLNLKNLYFIKMNANYIEDFFKSEIDTIYLNFSDPWPKDRHEKRRLTSINFLKKYDNIFKNKKRIIMKTDNRKLFEFSIKSFNAYNYKIKDISLDMYKDDYPFNVCTEYEIKFHEKGFPIYMINVYK